MPHRSMPHRSSPPRTIALALATATAAALAAAAPARGALAQSALQTTAAPAHRTIGDYNIGDGGRVKLDLDGDRIAVFAEDDAGSRVLLYVDPSSADRWLATADALMRGAGRRAAAGAEAQTPPLTHADPSVGGSLVLTREDVPRSGGRRSATEYYLTAIGDADHLALLPLSAMEARIVTAALRRAVDAARARE